MMGVLYDPITPRGSLMHHPLDTILNHLRQDIAHHLDPESILQACRDSGHRWRRCVLTPVVIIHSFVTQILLGNIAIEHVALCAKRLFTSEAYCRARGLLPLKVFQRVLDNLVQTLTSSSQDQGLWHGHRTWLVDGSSCSMPDTPELQQQFGQPSNQAPGCGFPVARFLAVFHAGTGLLREIFLTPFCSHEMSSVAAIHPAMKPGDVLVGDRGFCSSAHLAMLVRDGVFAVFRVHQRQIVDFTPHRAAALPGRKSSAKGRPRSRWLRSLGVLDQVVEWFKPEQPPTWMTAEAFAALPETVTVRELRYQVGRPGFRTRWVTLVTTLLDGEDYPLEELADLYATRWRVELYLRHLKTSMNMDVLKCKTVQGVRKEITVYAIVYHLVRVVMWEASRRQGVDVERISFVDAMRWLMQAEPGDALPKLVVNPHRPGRYEPRARKRRPKQYDLLNKPRAELRNSLLLQR
jgi:hypothetical protein